MDFMNNSSAKKKVCSENHNHHHHHHPYTPENLCCTTLQKPRLGIDIRKTWKTFFFSSFFLSSTVFLERERRDILSCANKSLRKKNMDECCFYRCNSCNYLLSNSSIYISCALFLLLCVFTKSVKSKEEGSAFFSFRYSTTLFSQLIFVFRYVSPPYPTTQKLPLHSSHNDDHSSGDAALCIMWRWSSSWSPPQL